MSLQVQKYNTVTFEEFQDAISDRLNIGKENLSPTALWVKDVGISSVDIVKIVMLIRQKFGVKVPTSQAARVKTVGDTYQLVIGG